MQSEILAKEDLKDLSSLDYNFLAELISQQHREIFAKVIALDLNELPVDTIEGKVTTGSINIDGDSTVRRTCSLTMVTSEIDINSYYWGLRTKFKLEIGLKNNLLNSYKYVLGGKYPYIVWFPQGTYLITTFNTSIATNSCTISLQGKDKMCLLNGDLSGALHSSIDFGQEEYKEKIIIPVNLSLVSSKELVVNKYYIKVKDDSCPDYIQNSNSLYFFEKDSTGNYYKYGNFYKKDDGEEREDIQRYTIYKIASEPEDFFEIIPSEELEEVTKKYVKEGDVYILSQDLDLQKTYYQLKEVYSIDYEYIRKRIPIEKIIKEAIHQYANEPYHNIVINDLDAYGLEQLTYRGNTPIYAIRNVATEEFESLLFLQQDESLKEIIDSKDFIEDSLTSKGSKDGATLIYKKQKNKNLPYEWNILSKEDKNFVPKKDQYTVAKIAYGDDVGYRLTDLTYAGDLISKAGETLTSILEKIKKMLGYFEYFYDLNGRFVFQKKRAYVDTYWSQLVDNEGESYVNYANDAEQAFAFNFEGNALISAFQNNPNLTNLKNDFTVWGKRKGISGQDIPIHARYAVDKKPTEYLAFNGNLYCTNKNKIKNPLDLSDITIKEVDWREIIYQMALDFFAGQGCSAASPIYNLKGEKVLDDPDLFFYALGTRNPHTYPTGQTGYEQYYTDIQGFWRELYNPDYIPIEIYDSGYYKEEITKEDDSPYYQKNSVWKSGTFSSLEINYYVSTLEEDDFTGNIIEQYNSLLEADQEKQKQYLKYYITENTSESLKKRKYWAVNVFEAPETLNFWLEFLDDDNELAQFAIPAVGDRTKVVNDDKVKAIFYKEIPGLLIKGTTTEYDESIIKEGTASGYAQINVPEGLEDYFTISYRGRSAKDKIDELLYQFAYCVENVSITAIPNYYIQPNTRIFIYDNEAKINGEYIISKITLPLTYNGTMSITAVKAPVKFY